MSENLMGQNGYFQKTSKILANRKTKKVALPGVLSVLRVCSVKSERAKDLPGARCIYTYYTL